MIVAEFTHDKHGWRCIKTWFINEKTTIHNKIEVVGNALFMPVKVKPKLGFSKRPHFYI